MFLAPYKSMFLLRSFFFFLILSKVLGSVPPIAATHAFGIWRPVREVPCPPETGHGLAALLSVGE